MLRSSNRVIRPLRATAIVASMLVAGITGQAVAQSASGLGETVDPRRETLLRLSQRVEQDFRGQTVGEVVEWVQRQTQAKIQPLWLDDINTSGIDDSLELQIVMDGGTALDLLERILEVAGEDFGDPEGFTWQLTANGAFEMGPKDRLNRRKTTILYDVHDLMLVLPVFDNAVEFDIQSVLDSQGGGSSNPLGGDSEQIEIVPEEERAEELQVIITSLIEPDQWQRNGGDGASVQYFRNNLIVRAPDYVHRLLNGYDFWPERLTRAAIEDGRRRLQILGDPNAGG